jgi:hypothetical protein
MHEQSVASVIRGTVSHFVIGPAMSVQCGQGTRLERPD